jgi:uncharacterized delta-60 repeat protein
MLPMFRIINRCTLLLVLVSKAVTLQAQDPEGPLDLDFSTDGKLTTGAQSGLEADLPGYRVTRNPQGTLICAIGFVSASGAPTLPGRVIRLLNDGGNMTSASFLASGAIGYETRFYNGLIDPSDRLVVVGEVDGPTGTDILVGRILLSTLTMDPTFGEQNLDQDGFVSPDLGSGDSRAWDVARQPDGKLVVVGWYDNGSDLDIAVVRYQSTGYFDPSFSSDGLLTVDLGGDELAHAVALQPDGKILIAGTKQTSTGSWFLLKRYLSNGSSDLQFGDNGTVLHSLDGGLLNDAWDVALKADGRIVVCGTAGPSGTPRPAIACFQANGSPDVTFGGTNEGHIVDNAPGSEGGFYSLAIEAGDTIVCAGYSKAATEDFLIARYAPNGQRWPDFGYNGWAIPQLGDGDARARSIELQPDQRILVGGTVTLNGNKGIGIARLISTNLGAVLVQEEAALSDEILIYPNPVAEQVTFTFSLPEQRRCSVHLADLQGRILAAMMEERLLYPGTHQMEVRIPSDLPDGEYMLIFTGDDRLRTTLRLTVSK